MREDDWPLGKFHLVHKFQDKGSCNDFAYTLTLVDSRCWWHILGDIPRKDCQRMTPRIGMPQRHFFLNIRRLCHRAKGHMENCILLLHLKITKFLWYRYLLNLTRIKQLCIDVQKPFTSKIHTLQWVAWYKRVTSLSIRTRTYKGMADDFAVSVVSAATRAWISAFLVYACEITRTLWITDTFRPTIRWCTGVIWLASARRRFSNNFTYWIGSTRWW